MKMLSDILKGIYDIVYPQKRVCLFCSTPLKGTDDIQLCGYCKSLLPFLSDNVCIKCGRSLQTGYINNECSECLSRIMYFDCGCSVFEFTGIIQNGLYRLKYDGEKNFAVVFGRLMARRLKKMNWSIDVLLPVPLHTQKLRERGFNQSYLMALEIGRELGMDVYNDILIRTRYTESQFKLSKIERLNNIKDAFKIQHSGRIKNKNVLIIDDIMTTGATLNECSKVLKNDGIGKVYCLTAACPDFKNVGF